MGLVSVMRMWLMVNVPDVLYSLNVWKTSAGHDEKHFQNVEGAMFNNTRENSFSDDVLVLFAGHRVCPCAQTGKRQFSIMIHLDRHTSCSRAQATFHPG